MATDTQVRVALADSLSEVVGLRGHAWTPGQLQGRDAVVIEVNVDFDASMQRGADEMNVVVRLLVGGDLRTAQQRLSELVYLVRDRLWSDPTLDDTVSDCRLHRKRGDSEGQVDVGGSQFAVVDLEVQIIT